MLNTVTVDEAPVRWPDLVAAIGRGEEWLVVDGAGQPIVKLTRPASDADTVDPTTAHASLFGMMKGKIQFPPGWDDPLDDFKPYTE